MSTRNMMIALLCTLLLLRVTTTNAHTLTSRQLKKTFTLEEKPATNSEEEQDVQPPQEHHQHNAFTLSYNPADERPPCDIDCKNGGSCYYVSDTPEVLEHESQAGRPIQRCHCPPDFGGVACEIPTERCNMNSLTCANSGRPCERVAGTTEANPQYTCACYVADTIGHPDPFAGRVCRKGYTEYCSSRYVASMSNLYFCTNGGKCLADFLAARVAPGNTTANRAYEDAGCRCNTNFYGPHCEYLKFDRSHLNQEKHDTSNNDVRGHMDHDGDSGDNNNVASVGSSSTGGANTSRTVGANIFRNKNTALFFILAFLGLVLMLSAYMAIRRHFILRRRRRWRRRGVATVHGGMNMPGGSSLGVNSSGRPQSARSMSSSRSGRSRGRGVVEHLDGARITNVDGFLDFQEDGGSSQQDVNSDVRYSDADPYEAAMQAVRHPHDHTVSVVDAGRYSDEGDYGHHVQHVVEDEGEIDNDSDSYDDDEKEGQLDDFFDDLDGAKPSQQELVPTNTTNLSVATAAASSEPQDIINSEQATTVSVADDAASKSTVPVSNTTTSGMIQYESNRVKRSGQASTAASRDSGVLDDDEEDAHSFL